MAKSTKVKSDLEIRNQALFDAAEWCREGGILDYEAFTAAVRADERERIAQVISSHLGSPAVGNIILGLGQ